MTFTLLHIGLLRNYIDFEFNPKYQRNKQEHLKQMWKKIHCSSAAQYEDDLDNIFSPTHAYDDFKKKTRSIVYTAIHRVIPITYVILIISDLCYLMGLGGIDMVSHRQHMLYVTA